MKFAAKMNERIDEEITRLELTQLMCEKMQLPEINVAALQPRAYDSTFLPHKNLRTNPMTAREEVRFTLRKANSARLERAMYNPETVSIFKPAGRRDFFIKVVTKMSRETAYRGEISEAKLRTAATAWTDKVKRIYDSPYEEKKFDWADVKASPLYSK